MATIRNVEVRYNGKLCYELVDDADWQEEEAGQLYYLGDPRAALYDTQDVFLDVLLAVREQHNLILQALQETSEVRQRLVNEIQLRERTQDAFMDEVERVQKHSLPVAQMIGHARGFSEGFAYVEAIINPTSR